MDDFVRLVWSLDALFSVLALKIFPEADRWALAFFVCGFGCWHSSSEI